MVNGDRWSRTADKIIGIQEIRGYLNGQYSLLEAKQQIKLNTRHFAKRQLKWFKREKRLNWIMIESEDNSANIAQSIIHECESQSQVSHL